MNVSFMDKAPLSIKRPMRITALIFLISTLHVSAAVWAQKVNYKGTNVHLSEVFNAITEQTGYGVLMSEGILNKANTVTVNFKDATLEEVLNKCFADQPFLVEYTFVGRTITISKKKISEIPPAVPSGDPNEISGTVRSEGGEPLVGATVLVKQLGRSGTTNEKGMFDLQKIPNGNYTVEISFVGFEKYTTQITVSDHALKLFAELRQSTSSLDQVQVIAYGTTTQRLSTGNITTVTAKDIEKQPVTNALLALEGRVPGLFITQNSGLPGTGVTVRVQGQNSIQSGNDPFYVVDGVPYPSLLLGTGVDGVLGNSGSTGGGSAGSPFSYINPADIESIEVLKDADATAIYGSRAANGAILITTKKGKAGNMKVDINLQNGWGKVTRKMKMLNTQQYLEMRNEAFINDGLAPDPTADYDLTLWDTTRYTDWQKTLIGGTAKYNNINASISGGTSNMQYLLGGTYNRQATVFPGDFSDKKASVHFNLGSTSLNKRFHTQFSANYMIDNNHLPQTDLTQKAIELEPDAPTLYNKDGSLNWQPDASGTSTWTNPLIYQYIFYKSKVSNLVSNEMLSYMVLPGLDVRSSIGYTNLQDNDFSGSPLIAARPETRPNTKRTAQFGYQNLNSWIIEPQATYKHNFGNGKLDFLLGATIQENSSSSYSVLGSGYNSDLVLGDIGAAASYAVYNSIVNQYKYAAIFSRLNYNWADKYIINLTARRDGSSRFGSATQFHDFGSAGIAWIFSQENFIKSFGAISFGKLRGSYGTTGNDQISDYRFLTLYNLVGNGGIAYQNNTGLLTGGLSNPYLEWELTRKLQFGLDLGFFKDRIIINANYARNRSSNQLLSYNLPSITGFGGLPVNFPATMQNTSWEIMLKTTNIKNKTIIWSSSFNLTIPRNKVVAFPGIENTTYAGTGSSVIVGQPVGIGHYFHLLGVDPTTGYYQLADGHGAPTASPNYPSDATTLISLFPIYYTGFQNSVSFKNFNLDFLFQYVRQMGPNYFFFNGNDFPGNFNSGASNQPVSVLKRWRTSGDKSPIDRFSTMVDNNSYNALQSDYYLRDASFIRLKNLSLSWQFPNDWCREFHFQNGSIYIQGQNLLTITRYKGMDPENLSFSSLPPLRVWTMGVKIGL